MVDKQEFPILSFLHTVLNDLEWRYLGVLLRVTDPVYVCRETIS